MKKITLITLSLFTVFCVSAQLVGTIAGSGSAAFADGVGTAASFDRPHDVAVDNAGNIYVTDQRNHCIRKIATNGQVTTIAGNPGVPGYQDGIGSSALFDNPTGIICYNNNLYISDYANHSIRLVSLSDFSVNTIIGNGTPGDVDGIGNAAQLGGPVGICIYSSTEILFTEQVNHKIKKLNLGDNSVTTFAGDGMFGSTNGPVATARFNAPYDVFSLLGNVVVADQTNHKIRFISGGNVSTFAGDGVAASTNGPTLNAQFHTPLSLTGDENGNLYVLDYGTSMLRKIDQSAMVSTVVGSGDQYVDGDFTVARFNSPTGMTFDNDGNLIIADHENHRIRIVDFDAVAGIIETSDLALTLYPNPAHSEITIQGLQNIERVTVFDLSGTIVLEGTSKELNIESLQSGLYLIRAIADGKLATGKFTKE